jgi:hypothetical protein
MAHLATMGNSSPADSSSHAVRKRPVIHLGPQWRTTDDRVRIATLGHYAVGERHAKPTSKLGALRVELVALRDPGGSLPI